MDSTRGFSIEEKEQENEIAESVTETVIPIEKPEPDKLMELDKEQLVFHVNSNEELIKLFRSIPTLSQIQIRSLEVRYISIMQGYEKRVKYIDFLYHSSRTIVSLGSVIVPALLSIGSPTGSPSVSLYWATWALSILVTICHNFSNIFRFDKKFFGIHSTLERLKSEGWQYLELSGHYSGHHGHVSPTYLNQYVYFVNSVERIKLKQVEDEYNTIKEPEKQTVAHLKPHGEQMVPSPLDLNQNRGKIS